MSEGLTNETVVGFALLGFGALMVVLGSRWLKRNSPIAPKLTPQASEEAADLEVLERLLGQKDHMSPVNGNQSSRVVRTVVAVVGFWPIALVGALIWLAATEPPPSPAEQERRAAVDRQNQQNQEKERYLCLSAAACRKYDEVRLECAAAGNFKTCLRIKMGNDAGFIDSCSLTEGGPALRPPPKTPTVVECFFLTLFR
jgi:hypothetical protein